MKTVAIPDSPRFNRERDYRAGQIASHAGSIKLIADAFGVIPRRARQIVNEGCKYGPPQKHLAWVDSMVRQPKCDPWAAVAGSIERIMLHRVWKLSDADAASRATEILTALAENQSRAFLAAMQMHADPDAKIQVQELGPQQMMAWGELSALSVREN